MFFDHPTMTPSNSQAEPDRLERPSRVDGDGMALATLDARARLVNKMRQIDGHEGTLSVTRGGAPSETEKEYFVHGRIGDGGDHAEHEL